jgi:hypothetical protein
VTIDWLWWIPASAQSSFISQSNLACSIQLVYIPHNIGKMTSTTSTCFWRFIPNIKIENNLISFCYSWIISFKVGQPWVTVHYKTSIMSMLAIIYSSINIKGSMRPNTPQQINYHQMSGDITQLLL